MLTNVDGLTELFHSADGIGYADLAIEGHRETWSIRSGRFRSWLRRQHYQATGEAPGAGVISDALNLLEARAQFDGPQRTVHLRVAQHEGCVYLDLADDVWRAVEITPEGWRVISTAPVRFRRTPGMLPLPVPTGGGSIDDLAAFFNIPNRSDFVLVLAWVLAALREGGPYPILAISGEQGSAKTVLSKMLRALVDPNVAPVRTAPREERDLFIAANNGHLLGFDNLSDLPAWTSDALCRLASGGSFAVRQLYTDRDEILFQAARPIILNGIEDAITRPDLADRAIFLTLPHLTERQRRPEKEVWRGFELARPKILGALMETLVHGLRALPQVRLEQLPRMADFALWATACETGFSPGGGFLQAYRANRRIAIEDVVEADPVAACIRDVMTARQQWTGTASDLLRIGGNGLSTNGLRWPKSPRGLAGRLRRAQTPLRALGIEIAFHREGHDGARTITVRRDQLTNVRTSDSTVSTVGTGPRAIGACDHYGKAPHESG
jgi:hypothetical protein